MPSLWRAARMVHTCHFCGCTSVLVPPYGDAAVRVARSLPDDGQHVSTGTPARWFCSACESWNYADEHGRPIDAWEREMWDGSVFSQRRGTETGSPQSRSGADDTPRVFCHTCLTNQTLVTNLLTDYLPDESDPSYSERVRGLDAYRRALDAKYPLVCAACAPRVNERIKSIDQQVQRQYLGVWVSEHRDASQEADETRPVQPHRKMLHKVAWCLATAAAIALAALGAIPTFWQIDVSVSRAHGSAYAVLLLAAAIPAPWCAAPKSLAPTRSAAHRGADQRLDVSDCNAACMHLNAAARTALVGIHIVSFVYEGSRLWCSLRVCACLALGILLCIVRIDIRACSRQLSCVNAYEPPTGGKAPVRLVSQPVRPSSHVRGGGDAALAALSLKQPIGTSASSAPLDELLEPSASAAGEQEEAMDVDTPEVSAASFTMGPQRFPSTISGLEDVFGSVMRLNATEDARATPQRALTSWTTRNMPLLALSLATGTAMYHYYV